MIWLNCSLYAIYSLESGVHLLWLANLLITLKKGNECTAVRHTMFVLTLVLVGLSTASSAQLDRTTVVFANISVMGCIITAFVRAKRDKVPSLQAQKNIGVCRKI